MLDPSIYHVTSRMKKKHISFKPSLLKLADYIKSKYQVDILNYFLDSVHNTPRLNIIVDTTEQYNKMFNADGSGYNQEYQKEIAQQFIKIMETTSFKNKITDLTAILFKKKYTNLENLFVCFTSFEEEAKTDTNTKMMNKYHDYFLEKYNNNGVWDIIPVFSTAAVFYFTESDVENNKRIGLDHEITTDYFNKLKQFDEFDYYSLNDFSIHFGSKEDLDKNFEGSLFYYFR